jgi:hypothetical protein
MARESAVYLQGPSEPSNELDVSGIRAFTLDKALEFALKIKLRSRRSCSARSRARR